MLLRGVGLGIATIIEETPPRVWHEISAYTDNYLSAVIVLRAEYPLGVPAIVQARMQTEYVTRLSELADKPPSYWNEQ